MKLQSPLLEPLEGIAHGFYTRRGGVSEGDYASLNCGPGSQDNPEAVAENRNRVAADLGAAQVHSLYQIHSPQVVEVTEEWSADTRPEADAMVTGLTGRAIGVLTADCGPVLFADPDARLIGAAHAGWKGALGGVLEATVEHLIALGAKRERLIAAIGPCISQPAYEVGPEFHERFLAAKAEYATFFEKGKKPGHWHFDLPRFIESRLAAAGVPTIGIITECTYADPERFFSFRRTTHQKRPDYGRQISAICLRP